MFRELCSFLGACFGSPRYYAVVWLDFESFLIYLVLGYFDMYGS